METKEVTEALEALKVKLEGSSKQEIKDALEAFETKNKEFIKAEAKAMFDAEIKSVKDELQGKLDAVQKHADKLDVKLQSKSTNKKPLTVYSAIKSTIVENGEKVSNLRSKEAIQLKVVGDMTTANLTGDEPKDYNFDIVKFPAQKVNVQDIVGSVSISGGTYTYTVEGVGEGSIGAQTEGADKNQRDYDFTAIDVTTDFIAGFARYSRKMRNNLSYITSAIPQLLMRDYYKAENASFQTVLAADATASTEIITGSSKSKMLINEIGKLEDLDYDINGITVRPSDYLDILKTAKQDLESAVTYENGILRVAGVQVLKATWLPANKYYVGDWSRVNKVTTEGLSLEFSDVEGSNFVKNNITARVEAQVALAVEQPLALVYGDFTAV